MTLAAVIAVALALDYLLGEPRRWHPLVMFGGFADQLEARFNGDSGSRESGILAWCLAVLPWVVLVFLIDRWFAVGTFLDAVFGALVLYLALGWRSLLQHAQAVLDPLRSGDLDSARLAVAQIVSRDTAALDEPGIARGAIESVLENGADAIFAAIFWFALLGPAGVVLYRLANTLDAMWGYRNERYYEFGWFAARADDLLNYLPAQLTALTYTLLGKHREQAFYCWRTQGSQWKSPNAGPVMAAGAGALNVSLGGNEIYDGEWQERPVLGPDPGPGTEPDAHRLQAACELVNRAVVVWCLAILLLVLVLR